MASTGSPAEKSATATRRPVTISPAVMARDTATPVTPAEIEAANRTRPSASPHRSP